MKGKNSSVKKSGKKKTPAKVAEEPVAAEEPVFNIDTNAGQVEEQEMPAIEEPVEQEPVQEDSGPSAPEQIEEQVSAPKAGQRRGRKNRNPGEKSERSEISGVIPPKPVIAPKEKEEEPPVTGQSVEGLDEVSIDSPSS